MLLIWGEDDKTLPLEEAKKMIPQFKNFKDLKIIPKAKLFVPEENPELVAQYSLGFLSE